MNIASRLNRIMGGQGVRKSEREPAHQERGSRQLYQETCLAKMAEIVYGSETEERETEVQSLGGKGFGYRDR